MENAIRESRTRPVADMNREWYDEALGTTFRAEAEPLELSTADGENLDDLYLLRVTASFPYGETMLEEVAEVYIYQPEAR